MRAIMRTIMLLVILLIFSVVLKSAVLDNVYFNAEDVALKNYGQYNKSSGFYLNPALLSELKNKQLNLNYINFYQGAGFNLNSVGISFGLPLSKIHTGIFSQIFLDNSDESADYNEIKFGIAFSLNLKNLNIGILPNYTVTTLDTEYLSANQFSDSKFGIIAGVRYKLPKYKLKLAYSFHKIDKHLFGAAYQFNDLNAIGIAIEKYFKSINIALNGTASIIKDRIILNFGLSPSEYSPGLKIKLPVRENKNFLFLNYTMRYSMYIKDSHYISTEINF